MNINLNQHIIAYIKVNWREINPIEQLDLFHDQNMSNSYDFIYLNWYSSVKKSICPKKVFPEFLWEPTSIKERHLAMWLHDLILLQ